ncbi:ribosomal protein subunit [Babesia caballi]|uniref:Ribosomal protein subunit n=1 Tax=Babesia caballi TaxID=5871 RepID=A0AAV4LN59_BABCB|nr:ribosomal protein subunit [Babesia caballi]
MRRTPSSRRSPGSSTRPGCRPPWVSRRTAPPPARADEPRHPFPHVLRYTVDWLAEASPAEHAKPTRVTVSFNMHELGLSESQLRKMKDILGPDRYDEVSGVAILQGDIFDDLNQNAHYLGKAACTFYTSPAGDITERLMRAVKE